MAMQVKLEEIIEGMESQSEENRPFLNLKTGVVVYVSREALWIAEEDVEEDEDLPEWQRDEVKIAYDIVENFGNYATLPSEFDIHEYDIMESFCYSLSDQNQMNILLNSIRGRGAFRRFKDNIYELGISDQWYGYRDNRYKEIAISFCESHNIDYVE